MPVVRAVPAAGLDPGSADAAEPRHLGQVRRHRRQRPRHAAAARGRGADGRAIASQFKYPVRADARRQHLRGAGDAGGLPPEVRGALRRAAEDGVKFYAVARESRRSAAGRTTRRSTWRASGTTRFVPPEDILARLTTRVEFFALDSTNLDRGADCTGSTSGSRRRARSGRSCFSTTRSTRPAATVSRRAHSACGSSRSSSGTASTSVFSGHEHIYQRTTLHERRPVLHQRGSRLAAARRRRRRRRSSPGPSPTTITSC